MQPILSRRQMREYDRIAIEELGIPGVVLMENAGRGASEIIWRLIAGLADPKAVTITIVCGVGNNGGDGFVVARHLAHELIHGLDAELIVQVFIIGDSSRIKGDAAIKLAELRAAGINPTEIQTANLAELKRALAASDIIVDALFGTGLARPIEGIEAEAIKLINAANGMRVALDLPSGLDADTGMTLGIAVHASHSMSFAYFKPGLLTPAGREHAGKLHRVSLGIQDESILKQTGVAAYLIGPQYPKAVILTRKATTYKHRAGDVLVIAGSRNKIGAAKLVAEAALRTGAGLATIFTWPDAIAPLATWAREVMLCEVDSANIDQTVAQALAKRSAIVIGPGLGLGADAAALVNAVLIQAQMPVVIDADALTLIATSGNLPAPKAARILTPHSGELARLLKTTPAVIETDRFSAAARAAREFNAIVVLKGAHTLIASPAGDIYVTDYANAVLATAGTGDVLSGIIGALAANLPPIEAACAGVILHAAAAELWCKEFGADRGMLAGDIIDRLPAALGKLIF